MNQFIHTVDNRIVINNTEFPLSTFLLLEPGYSLPSPYERRTYIQNISHILYDEDGFIYQDLGSTWVEGDLYISRLSDYTSGEGTAALQEFISIYVGAIESYTATDINDPLLPLFRSTSLLKTAINLSQLDKISLENQYPEFTNIASDILYAAIKSDIFDKLLETDWTQLSDSGLSLQEVTDWTNYRQGLKVLCGTPNLNRLTEVVYSTPPADPKDRC